MLRFEYWNLVVALLVNNVIAIYVCCVMPATYGSICTHETDRLCVCVFVLRHINYNPVGRDNLKATIDGQYYDTV